mgnify:CR=1 FL=1
MPQLKKSLQWILYVRPHALIQSVQTFRTHPDIRCMSYLVLARKYRPQTFEEIVQQEHVTQTLIHAIEADRVAHAILFSGPRGTGKTTIARILAKALNCENGPTPRPCGVCPSCTEIASGLTVDVYEIDGASNNSVDQIRDLRENIVYLPVHGRYKIYIIDEVHMLSMAAFNALLKTLEEPPAHIKFFFATTEPQKIPATILSRCQRHDLKRISISAIVDHLKQIASAESISISDASLRLIAREATGGMRDALSLLDQVISFSQGTISDTDVLRLFGVVDEEMLTTFTDALLYGQTVAALEGIHRLHEAGKDLKRFYVDCMNRLRNLLLVKLGVSLDVMDMVTPEEIDGLKRQAASLDAIRIRQILDLLHREEPTIRYASNPRLSLEMVIFRWAEIRPALSVDRLIEAIEQAARNLSPSIPSGEAAARLSLSPVPSPQQTQTIQERPAVYPEASPSSRPVHSYKAPPDEAKPSCRDTSDSPVLAEAPAASEPYRDADAPSVLKATAPQTNDLLALIRERLVQMQNPSLAGFLAPAQVLDQTEERIVLALNAAPFIAAKIRNNETLLRRVCSEVVGKTVDLQLIETVPTSETQTSENPKPIDLKTLALNHPKVSEIIEIFGGSVVDIRIPAKEASP